MSITQTGRRREAGVLSPEDYAEAVRETSPFAGVRVSEPSALDIDVATVHEKEFNKLIARADLALKDRRGVGVALLGAAGVGKSHLLSRLYRWANERVEPKRTRACYVFLHNLLADPDRLPRYLLKCILSGLTLGNGRPAHDTPLFRLIDDAVHHALKAANAGPDEMTMRGGGKAFRNFLGQNATDPDVSEVLFQFYRAAYPRPSADPSLDYLAECAVAWLSGEEIDAEAARAMNLDPHGEESAALRDDQQVEQVILALCRLALVRQQPFILCVDQVDNLDEDKLKGLSRFLHAVIDHAPNLLVIVSGVQKILTDLVETQVIPQAAWDRLAEYKVLLSRIKPADARKIFEARLERFHEPFMELEPIKRQVTSDSLFPLGLDWMNERFGDALELRPREVLMWARDAWEDQQDRLATAGLDRWLREWPGKGDPHPPEPPEPTRAEIEAAIDARVEQKIEEQLALHRLHRGSLPPDAGNLTGLVLALLEQCRGAGSSYTFRDVVRLGKRKGCLPAYDLEILERREGDGREVRTGLLFITSMGTTATFALRRLLECAPAPEHRLLVTDHERKPLKTGPRGVEYYQALKRLKEPAFHHIKLTFEQYAALDALEQAVRLARVGDLEVEVPRGHTRPVTEAEVIASHHRRDRYRKHPLLHHLLTEEPVAEPETVAPPPLREPEVRQYIRAQLAWKMGSTAHALTKGFVESMPAPKADLNAAWRQLKEIVGKMNAEGLVHAQPLDDDLYMILGK